MNDEMMCECVENVLTRAISEKKIPGACVAMCRNGKSILRCAKGESDRESHIPMKENAIFRIFSMTKPVTAMATMMLWEEGKLELSDPVWWYFPSFRQKQVEQNGVLEPAKRDILIQDLLNMTSGLPYPDCQCLSQQKMGTFFAEINRRNDTEKPVTTQEFADRIGRDVPLMFQPGEKWAYGTSADILGAVLEKVADMPLDEFYRERIFTPLAMEDTDFWIPAEKRNRLTQLYTWNDAAQDLCVEPDPHLGMTDYHAKPAFCSGGAGLCSTLDDYTKFANCLAGKGLHRESGVRLISENTWRYMTTPQISQNWIDWPQLRGYRYGNLLRVLESPQLAMSNAPKGEFGWDGWTGPYLSVSPNDEESVFVYMIQVCGGSTSDVVRRLRTILFAAS